MSCLRSYVTWICCIRHQWSQKSRQMKRLFGIAEELEDAEAGIFNVNGGEKIMKLYIIGAGPGAPDLITVRGLQFVTRSRCCPVCRFACQ